MCLFGSAAALAWPTRPSHMVTNCYPFPPCRLSPEASCAQLTMAVHDTQRRFFPSGHPTCYGTNAAIAAAPGQLWNLLRIGNHPNTSLIMTAPSPSLRRIVSGHHFPWGQGDASCLLSGACGRHGCRGLWLLLNLAPLPVKNSQRYCPTSDYAQSASPEKHNKYWRLVKPVVRD